MSQAALKARKRADYPFIQDYRTRWLDNDSYTHLNNSIYYHLFDSITNAYLILHCSQSTTASLQIGLVVHSHCDYFAPTSFPAVLDVGLRVKKLGKSSVTYEIGVFESGEEGVRAVGEFVHVFVEREGRKVMKVGMPEGTRQGLGRLLVRESKL